MIHTLEIDSVMLEFNARRILQDIYIKSEAKQITGLLGRNGTGKTCLMNIIYGQLIPNEYSVRIDKEVLLKSFRPPETMRYLPQFSFIPKSLKIKRIFKDFNIDFLEFTISFPEFEKYYESKISKLSSGEQRIIEIYIILVSETRFVMLDEPFSQVMPLHIDAIKNIILREKKNKGIIITDHLYEHIIDICDNLYVINNGKTILINDIDELAELGYINSIGN